MFQRFLKSTIKIKDGVVISFFILIPFCYAIQVIFLNRYLGIFPFIFLLLLLAAEGVNFQKDKNYFMINNKNRLLNINIYLFILFILYSISIEIYYAGISSGVRLFLIFMLPILIYFYIKNSSDKVILLLIKIIIITATLVSIELFYEFICIEPTGFQKMNYHYVKVVSSMDQPRYMGYQRSYGLLGDIHTTALYMAIGMIGSLIFYYFYGKKKYFFTMLICYIGLISCGVRIVLCIIISIVILLIILNLKKIIKTEYSKKIILLRATELLSILLVTVFVIKLTEYNQYFWKTIYLDIPEYGFIPGSSFFYDYFLPEKTRILNLLTQNIYFLLFGYGNETTLALKNNIISSDVIVFQILGQFGIFGFIVFYSLFLNGGIIFLKTEKKINSNQKPMMLFAFLVLLMSVMTTIHRDPILRKAVYSIIFFCLGIISKYSVFKSIKGKEHDQILKRRNRE